MAKIVIDGVTYEVNGDNNLLQECLSKGLDLPYFCWHPCMGSVGACRQCAVKQYRDEDDKTGTLVMACMTPASDGSIISIDDDEAQHFRASVIESLMISHPHDCPVCEEGGECHLQDMTLMSGHNYRRYDRKKVTHRNQYLGPFVGHEMNRCITCYRCVRFYNDYAGGTDLSAQASHHHTYFGRQTDGCLESEFSGNLVEVCPTGVFTDATFSAHYSRKWDLQTAPSICVGCSVGCNTTPGERYGELRRVVNRYHGDVNGYFLCDRGRFGYGFVNSEERLTGALSGQGDQREAIPLKDGADRFSQLLEGATANVIGIGSPRASIEANYALLKKVGTANFYSGLSDEESALSQRALALLGDTQFHSPSIREIEQADAVLIVGEDVTNIAPRVALALRQSVRNRASELAAATGVPQWQDSAVRELAQRELSPLYQLSGYASRLDDIARETVIDDVAGLTRLACNIAGALDSSAPVPEQENDTEKRNLISAIAGDLKGAKRPLIVCGTSSGNVDLLNAAANIARALSKARGAQQPIDLSCLFRDVNTVGLGLMTDPARSLGSALQKMQAGEAKVAIVIENDLYTRAPSAQVDAAIGGVETLVAIDQLATRTTERADLVLACTTFAEQEGTYVNFEGRAQLSMQVFISSSDNRPSWRWLTEGDETNFNHVLQDCDAAVPGLKGISGVLPDLAGAPEGMKIPRQSHRYSGRTAMRANENVHEGKQPQDIDSVMAFSMEGMSTQKNASVMASSWAPQWNSNQSITKFQDEVAGELRQAAHDVMLIDGQTSTGDYLAVSAGETAGNGGFSVIPAYQLYGSDELSSRSVEIGKRLTGSYAAVSPTDAEQLGLTENTLLELQAANGSANYAVCVRSKVKPGTVVVFDSAGSFPIASAGESVKAAKVEGIGHGRFDNLIVSDLGSEEG